MVGAFTQFRRWRAGSAGLLAAAALSWACAAGAQAPAAAEPGLPSPDVFFKLPAMRAVSLSPDGTRVAMIYTAPGRRSGLFVVSLDDPGRPKAVALFDDMDVRSYRWVNRQRLVFDVMNTKRGSGDQEFASGLFSILADGQDLRQLVKLDRGGWTVDNRRGREPLAYNHQLRMVPVGGGDEVVVERYDFNTLGELTQAVPLRLNVETGLSRSIVENAPAGVRGWVYDRHGEPRMAITQREGRAAVHGREPGGSQWTQWVEGEENSLPWEPAMFDGTGRLYVKRVGPASGGSVQELVRWDDKARAPEEKAFVSTPGFDFNGALLGDTEGRLLGVSVLTDAQDTVWFEPSLKALQAQVDAKLPGRVNTLSCVRCLSDDRVALVYSSSPAEPGRWLVIRGQSPDWIEIGRARPDVDPRRAARVEFHRIKARDGRDLPVWLTLPPGRKAGQGGPAVVLVHGGPWVRGGDWDWSPYEQFLASRGYVVISPEFRGSLGFGMDHFRAGWRQWGRAMQDDVADAVTWTTGKGWADASRVCIAGASYGGYAVLMGLVRHPELYRCGVSWVGVTDPMLLMAANWRSDIPADARRYGLTKMIGDPKADAEMLREVSPVVQAAKITRPLLLAYGAEDNRVPIDHGEKIREAMRAQGRNPEYVVYPGEGHSFLKIETFRDFAQRMEAFLARHTAP